MRSIAVVYNNLSFNGGTLSQLQLFNAYVRGDSLVQEEPANCKNMWIHVDPREKDTASKRHSLAHRKFQLLVLQNSCGVKPFTVTVSRTESPKRGVLVT
ncbi:hypothetical protein MPTK1_7g01730 [Marchantia polymorpha subsp. ruderalis]|uniref:Uncharacterized protein n=2 Tax=Marchantia polymorpha TaxID=3197 RepID=A0AAF6BV48_MARPO|nr:hypothetical protein MARPO_0099s0046 [Marchantia polymorpha]BBN15882.1 hypothetical protein Mp_7g01730 [Marchantia polymorpha subsp. ruderalis]|eukprot:PTQ32410.1 hypothetical protein MARPO_0099s0046 [Marchantia polymorpha]